MRIAAIGDVHGTLYLDDFKRSLNSLSEVDLFLFAGDIARRNTLSEFAKVVKLIDVPIIAVFGNEEWENENYISAFPKITFLREEATVFDGLRIVGSTGALDKPTRWQAENIPDINSTFTSRIDKIRDLLDSDSLLLTHYASTYLTLVGEDPMTFPHLGSEKLERVILEKRPKLVVHAHAHLGKPRSVLDGITIMNVSVPVNNGITVIEF